MLKYDPRDDHGNFGDVEFVSFAAFKMIDEI
jgi:hypothetical protein